MSYQDQLNPWVVYRQLPNLQRLEVARFRRRNDAEEYLKIVQRLAPQAPFEIVYEIRQDEPTGELDQMLVMPILKPDRTVLIGLPNPYN